MKYFVYQYLWRKHGQEEWKSANSLHRGSATSLFEDSIRQVEEICLTAVVEISKKEYDEAAARGVIG